VDPATDTSLQRGLKRVCTRGSWFTTQSKTKPKISENCDILPSAVFAPSRVHAELENTNQDKKTFPTGIALSSGLDLTV
jgi:hypothetical protein